MDQAFKQPQCSQRGSMEADVGEEQAETEGGVK